ncbi:hypothetical protein [Veronia pacifica]|uniref:Uncharacterized protein n=1 Tax=Veronia pacifica TaxID=1080227 RepID=A0A1C3ERT4_9GAMM|nr:hypothetical protein [Veronia pacifica]ODA35931.1 hypothetical protein A8L45_02555 [Veronia pacifica]
MGQNISFDDLVNASQLSFLRWLVAGLIVCLVAPLVSPFGWLFIFVEGVDLSALAVVLSYILFIGLPFTLAWVALFSLIIRFWSPQFSRRSAFKWMIGGGILGFIIVAVPSLIDAGDNLGGLSIAYLLISGLVCGAFAGWLFLKVLLFGRR